MSANEKKLCREMERLLVLYSAGELEAQERARVEAHAAECAACAEALDEERALAGLVASRPQEEPSALLLARCRSELADALDAQQPGGFWGRVAEALRPKRWFALHPAMTAVFYVMLGITAGLTLPRLLMSPAGTDPARRVPVAVIPVSESDWERVNVYGLVALPQEAATEPPRVEVRYALERPEVLQGTIEDPEVRRFLIRLAQDNQRFNSGLRLDSVELLRARAADAEVQEALCTVARTDRNPGVRLRALEALRAYAREDKVRKTLLEALLKDDSPGARLEAIATLRAVLEQPEADVDQELMRVLEDRSRHDSNNYVRMQSAAALRLASARPPY
jgi:hypothetical protein